MDSYSPILQCLCHRHIRYTHRCEIQQQRSALPIHVTYPLTTTPVTINTHCSLTHSATLQRSGIRDITTGSGVFRDVVPRLQQCASYFHSVVRFHVTRVVDCHVRLNYSLFLAHFHDIHNSQQRYMNAPDIKFYSNLCNWRVWIEINLRPEVKYDFHSADFHDTQVHQQHYVQISYFRFSFNMEEKCRACGENFNCLLTYAFHCTDFHDTQFLSATIWRFYIPRFAQIYREIC
jgi:hypothetical protein